MFRYLNAAVRIVFFGLATLGILAWHYPYWAAGVIAFFVAFYYADKGDQKRLAATAELRAMSPTEYEQHCAELLRQAGWTVRHLQQSEGHDLLPLDRMPAKRLAHRHSPPSTQPHKKIRVTRREYQHLPAARCVRLSDRRLRWNGSEH